MGLYDRRGDDISLDEVICPVCTGSRNVTRNRSRTWWQLLLLWPPVVEESCPNYNGVGILRRSAQEEEQLERERELVIKMRQRERANAEWHQRERAATKKQAHRETINVPSGACGATHTKFQRSKRSASIACFGCSGSGKYLHHMKQTWSQRVLQRPEQTELQECYTCSGTGRIEADLFYEFEGRPDPFTPLLGAFLASRGGYQETRSLTAVLCQDASTVPPWEIDAFEALKSSTLQDLTRHSRNQTGKLVTMPEWASNY